MHKHVCRHGPARDKDDGSIATARLLVVNGELVGDFNILRFRLPHNAEHQVRGYDHSRKNIRKFHDIFFLTEIYGLPSAY